MLNSQSAPKLATAFRVALSILTGISIGCSNAPPASPTETFSVTSVFPNTGTAGDSTELSISGSGFEPGASVTVGGAATSVRVIRSTLIIAVTPISPAGKVDVVVTNSNGQSGTLAGAFTYLGRLLIEVSPKRGLPGDLLSILGPGLGAGVVATVGGVASPVVTWSSTAVWILVPPLPPGIVDITVTTPSGQRQTLAQAFTIETAVISASPGAVTVGAPLSVTWGAPEGRPALDWVGLFRFGASNEDTIWWAYTGGSAQGTMTIPAPNPPGDYQFRYLADDGYIDAARSGVVKVTAAGGNALATASARAIPKPPTAVPLSGRGRGRGR